MKKTIILILILMIPVAYAFTGESTNYKTIANIGLGAVLEHSSANYTTEGEGNLTWVHHFFGYIHTPYI